MRTSLWIIIAAIVICAAAACMAYPHLPESMASHFDAQGNPDGYAPKAFVCFGMLGIFAVPLFILLVFWASSLSGLNRDPSWRSAVSRAGAGTAAAPALLLAYVYLLVLLWNVGVHFSLTLLLLPVILLLPIADVVFLLPLLKLEIAASRARATTRPKGIWFPAKYIGWGWGMPCAWQGWVVMGLWMAGVLAGTLLILLLAQSALGCLLFLVAMVAALVAVCYWKGEKPRWRYGAQDKQP